MVAAIYARKSTDQASASDKEVKSRARTSTCEIETIPDVHAASLWCASPYWTRPAAGSSAASDRTRGVGDYAALTRPASV
jgi:hypothetical protein